MSYIFLLDYNYYKVIGKKEKKTSVTYGMKLINAIMPLSTLGFIGMMMFTLIEASEPEIFLNEGIIDCTICLFNSG